MRYGFLLVLLMLVGCASEHPGDYVRLNSGENPENLRISVDTDSTYTYGPYVFYNIVFGNEGDEWIRVKNVEIDDFPKAPDARIIVGQDLVSWDLSMQRKLSIEGHNRNLVVGTLATVALVGAAVAGAKGNTGGAIAGLAATGGVLTVDGINRAMRKATEAERATVVPPEHIYSSFTVPPSLTTAKWLLVQFPGQVIPCNLNMTVTYIDGKKASYVGRIHEVGCVRE